jgi:predicted metal-dependent HD superfamily phosphohydrolase
MDYQQLSDDVKQYVLNYFNTHHDSALLYHDTEHTKGVVVSATQIANHYQLNEEDFFVVATAAWFHDIGYLINKADHEGAGADLAADFLRTKNLDHAVIDKVKSCILATRIPQRPGNLLQQIMCDADLFHLGTEDFAKKSKLLRKEFNVIKNLDIDKQMWRQKNIELLQAHTYFTDYAQLLLHDQQKKNLDTLVKKQQQTASDDKREDKQLQDEPVVKAVPVVVIADENNNKKEEKKSKPDKGIETMFRITSGNNQRLSDMADNKAHILITVNSIILSAIISLVLRKLEENSFLAIPLYIAYGELAFYDILYTGYPPGNTRRYFYHQGY